VQILISLAGGGKKGKKGGERTAILVDKFARGGEGALRCAALDGGEEKGVERGFSYRMVPGGKKEGGCSWLCRGGLILSVLRAQERQL